MTSRHLSRSTTICLSILTLLSIFTFLNLSPNGQKLLTYSQSFDLDILKLNRQPLFPWEIDQDITHYKVYNEREIAKLDQCLKDKKQCHRNQEKVVLGMAHVWPDAIINGWRGGEGVWAMSMFKAMRQLGYTVLIGMNEWDETLEYYRMFPDQVKVIIKSAWIDNCIKNPECIKSDLNPTGIPRWKRDFSMNFFPDEHTRFGLDYKWIIHADRKVVDQEETGKLQYIGYSFEDECKKREFIPHDQRPNSAWILAKQATLFHLSDKETVFNRSYFELATKEDGLEDLEFRGAYQVNGEYMKGWINDGPVKPVPYTTNLGKINSNQFEEELSKSRIMIGIGNPTLSPSPYLSLCFGTPFLNPIKSWDSENPQDRSKWNSQHNYLKWFDPPYVYNVKAHDYEEFINSIKKAIQNPPPQFIDKPMTEKGVRDRVERLVETDWKFLAKEYMEEQIEKGQVYTWTL
ncbi:uncharacterized protein L201_003180 [Kwoniella dendrophila CBS 6074]|uniref:Glycosyltransferase family 18 catalytic domain-containing protein n=1 Tax=Kwoniella dendrophila CBS 6074 TaxID=1295534 RepID=A0AAX4JUT3_9TREE